MSQLALSFICEGCAYFERREAVRIWAAQCALPVARVSPGTGEWLWLICGCYGVSGQMGDFRMFHQRIPVWWRTLGWEWTFFEFV